MGNVYEVSAKKVITSTNTDFIELEDGLDVENEEVSKELGELILDQMSCFRNQEGDKKTDVSVDVLPSNQKEGSYYCFTRKNYNPEVIVNNCGIVGERMGWTFHPEDGVFMRNLEDDIDVPPETISILYYSIKRHSRMSHTYLPHTKLCFYFNIEKEKVVKLWNNGKINELMTHNIIPTNPNQFNRQDYIWTRGLRVGGRKIVKWTPSQGQFFS